MIKSVGNGKQFKELLIKSKKDFQLIRTSNSTVIIYKDVKYFYSIEDIPNEFLYLYKQIKEEIKKNILQKNLKVPIRKKSKYFDIFNMDTMGLGEFKTFDNIIESDINKAYYKVLFILGYISEDFYKKCITLPKKVRLSLVGSIATYKYFDFYEAGELIEDKSYDEKDKLLRNVFFHCVNYTDNALSDFQNLAGDYFIFYWVDGIYLKNYPLLRMHLYMIEETYNIDFETCFLNRIVALKTEDNLNLIGVQKNAGDKIKVFNFPNVLINKRF